MYTITFDEPLLAETDERSLARTIEAGILAAAALESGAVSPHLDATELAEIRRLGDIAFNRFVEANLRLVTMVTYPAAIRAAMDADDLFQEGVLGLLEAVRRYDHVRGARFVSFAMPWIRMRVGECVVTRAGSVGLPPSRAKLRAKVITIRDALEAAGLQPSPSLIAERAGVSVSQVRALLAYAPASAVSDAGTLAAPPAPRRPATDPLATERLLRLLGRDERDLLRRLYGLAGRRRESYEQLAEALGTSASTIRRRERAALARLRAPERERVVA